MTKENIKLFSEMHAEPSWLADLRQKAFDKIESLELPVIERVKFHRWNLGDGTITESEPSANVPDFTALDNHLKLVQVGTQTVFEQTPVELAEQGVVFTDFHSALEEIPELIEEFFMSSVKYDDDKLAAYHQISCANSDTPHPNTCRIKGEASISQSLPNCRIYNCPCRHGGS